MQFNLNKIENRAFKIKNRKNFLSNLIKKQQLNNCSSSFTETSMGFAGSHCSAYVLI